MKPKLKAFLVSTQWSDGVGSLGISLSFNSDMASGSAVAGAMRNDPPPQVELVALIVREIEPAALRTILTQLETGNPSADVLKLVRPESGPQQCEHHWDMLPSINSGYPPRWKCAKCGQDAPA